MYQTYPVLPTTPTRSPPLILTFRDFNTRGVSDLYRIIRLCKWIVPDVGQSFDNVVVVLLTSDPPEDEQASARDAG